MHFTVWAASALLLTLRVSAQDEPEANTSGAPKEDDPPKGQIVPCFNGQCNNCSDTAYRIDKGWPTASFYEEFSLEGYSSSANTLNLGQGYAVFWNIPDPDEGCRFNVYSDYVNDVRDKGDVPGNLILSTSRGGCFFAQMTGGRFSTSFCCGDGHCREALPDGTQGPSITRRQTFSPEVMYVQNATQNSTTMQNATHSTNTTLLPTTNITKTDDPSVPSNTSPTEELEDDEEPEEPEESEKPKEKTIIEPSKIVTYKPPTAVGTEAPKRRDVMEPKRLRRTAAAMAAAQSLVRRSDNKDYCPDMSDDFDCRAEKWEYKGQGVKCDTQKKSAYRKALRQIKVTAPFTCNSAECTASSTQSQEIGSTITTEHSITETDSNGETVSINAGVNLLDVLNFGVSESYNKEYSKAIMDSSGSQNSTSSSKSETYPVSLNAGVTGFLTFTPMVDCFMMTSTCNDVPIEFEYCQPSKMPNSEFADGEYVAVNWN